MEKLEPTPMSDKVKDRIEKEADESSGVYGVNNLKGSHRLGYIAGATAERPKAWNEAIDAAIFKLKDTWAWTFADNSDRAQQIKELEALKHKQP